MFKAYTSIKASEYWASVEDFTVRDKGDYIVLEIWDPQYPNEPGVQIFRGEGRIKFLKDLETMEAAGDIQLCPDAEDKGEWVSPYPTEPELDLDKMDRLREEEEAPF